MSDNVKIGELMKQYTHVVEYSPNCPVPYLVRMAGKGAGVIDKLPPSESKDSIGFGQTFDEAAQMALNIRNGCRCKAKEGLRSTHCPLHGSCTCCHGPTCPMCDEEEEFIPDLEFRKSIGVI